MTVEPARPSGVVYIRMMHASVIHLSHASAGCARPLCACANRRNALSMTGTGAKGPEAS